MTQTWSMPSWWKSSKTLTVSPRSWRLLKPTSVRRQDNCTTNGSDETLLGALPENVLGILQYGFTDEVFRVFVEAHPEIDLHVVHINASVQQMIRHVSGAEAAILLGQE